MTDLELAWLAGFLEGEGSFMKGAPSDPNRSVISVQTTDEDIANRVARFLGSNVWKAAPPKKKHWKQVYVTARTGRAAVEMMRLLYPHMGLRRRGQIESAVASFQDKSKKISSETANLIREALKNATQGHVAEQFGIRRETVNRIAKGRVANRTRKRMVAVV